MLQADSIAPYAPHATLQAGQADSGSMKSKIHYFGCLRDRVLRNTLKDGSRASLFPCPEDYFSCDFSERRFPGAVILPF